MHGNALVYWAVSRDTYRGGPTHPRIEGEVFSHGTFQAESRVFDVIPCTFSSLCGLINERGTPDILVMDDLIGSYNFEESPSKTAEKKFWRKLSKMHTSDLEKYTIKYLWGLDDAFELISYAFHLNPIAPQTVFLNTRHIQDNDDKLKRLVNSRVDKMVAGYFPESITFELRGAADYGPFFLASIGSSELRIAPLNIPKSLAALERILKLTKLRRSLMEANG